MKIRISLDRCQESARCWSPGSMKNALACCTSDTCGPASRAASYISFLNVIKEHQRKGVGKAMLRHLEAQLREQGKPLLLSSRTIDEHEPQEWHRPMGFVEFGFFAGSPFEDWLR